MLDDKHWMGIAYAESYNSSCCVVKVGTVLVDNNGEQMSRGFNKKYNCGDEHECTLDSCKRSLRGGCFYSVHAEVNAIVNAINNGGSDFNSVTLYTTLAPCLSCAKLIYRIGIRNVVYSNSYASIEHVPIDEGVQFLKDMNCNVIQININES